ncbi:hypothetical protein [Bradyrhizobium sp. 174]|uniref:hypothetical protein n=1 Tax=Bradyrhizobium sp. 174 TaxID=2782645 RepID=UPI001FFBC875|nr:hypothetical protein [Bradyrhizobium sp. 174]MCK1574072.1 hypothetical protein [Bradyrhizobium sp. 174]
MAKFVHHFRDRRRFQPHLRNALKVIAAVALLGFIGLLLVPAISDRIDQLADQSQSKCPKYGRAGDPLHTARPAHAGEVLAIRLTNAGEFVDRCELTDILYDLNWDYERCPREFRPRISPSAERLPKLVVMYIHGWKHSGDNEDEDRKRFGEFVAKLSVANRHKKQVLGIFIGWNAKARLFPLTLPYLENLTFWTKKRVADRIAQSAVVTKVVGAIGAVLNQSQTADDQFVAIGHSFGARLLFSATGQTLIYETEYKHPGYPGGRYKPIRGPADAIILLNPAFEASLFTAMNDTSRREEIFENQPPLLVSISSTGDWATKKAFPVGQWFDGFRSEREMITLGNYHRFQTHVLYPSTSEACFLNRHSADVSETFFASGLCFARVPKTAFLGLAESYPHNPFLVASTSEKVIKDHNDIWGEQFRDWLFDFINALQKRLPAHRIGLPEQTVDTTARNSRCQL